MDSIISLISPNPKADRDKILYYRNTSGRKCLTVKNSSPPLRAKYVDGDDGYIENILVEYLKIVDENLLSDQPERSYAKKTVGYQAFFDFLKYYLIIKKGKFDKDDVLLLFKKINKIDFTDNFFTASGLGRSRMKNVMLIKTGIKSVESLRKNNDYETYLAYMK